MVCHATWIVQTTHEGVDMAGLTFKIPSVGVTGLVRPSRAEEIDRRVALLDKESYLMLEKDNQFKGWEEFLTWWYGSTTGLQDSLRYSELLRYGVKDVVALSDLAAFTIARARALNGLPPLKPVQPVMNIPALPTTRSVTRPRRKDTGYAPSISSRRILTEGSNLGLGCMNGKDKLG
jgi:hypothetical protein